jgi:hypothetical protein
MKRRLGSTFFMCDEDHMIRQIKARQIESVEVGADLSLTAVQDAIFELSKRGDEARVLIVPQTDLPEAEKYAGAYGIGFIGLPNHMLSGEHYAVAGNTHVIWFHGA